jgi:hypothetical protein
MPFSLASLLSSSNASSSNRTVRAFFEWAGTNFTCSTGVSSSANSSLEWVSQKAASSSVVLKVGMRLLGTFGCSCSFLVIDVPFPRSQVRSALRVISISSCDQPVHTLFPRSNKYRQISACLGLSNDMIASQPCLPNKRRTKDNFFNLCNAYLVARDMLFSSRLDNKFVDFHKQCIFLQLL